MAGMDRNTGRWISGWDHTSQSLDDIVTTPLGSRVLRRMYGAEDDALVDKPATPKGLAPAVMAVAVPVHRWEPRVRLRNVAIASASVLGKLTLRMRVLWRPRALRGDMTPAGEMQTGAAQP